MPSSALDRYGIIGNTHTTALVGLDGSIDWFCSPKHDSPSLFAAILDPAKGGRFQICPASSEGITPSTATKTFEPKQLYWPQTNILITRFLGLAQSGEIVDFMPIGLKDPHHRAQKSLVRLVRATHGSMRFQLQCSPAFNYALDAHQAELTEAGACFDSQSHWLELASQQPLQLKLGSVTATFTLKEGECAVFLLRSHNQTDENSQQSAPLSLSEAEALLEQTKQYWHRWLSQCTYRGRWREQVERSALLLKLLTYSPTGAILAAPTTSLPESLGGSLNWDYRYTWIRDSAYTIYALMRIGFNQEASAFIRWIESQCRSCIDDGYLKVAYTIDGQDLEEERSLPHLAGYRASQPVRIGNIASQQFQLDIYGAFVDAVYLSDKYGEPITHEFWDYLYPMLDWLCDNWQRDDQSIWEIRNELHPFVHSKVMCWVALDRGIRLAQRRSLQGNQEHWRKTRDRIYQEVMERGWSDEQQSFLQRYDASTLDASLLIMPLVFFLSPNDSRLLKMLDTFLKPLDQGGLCVNHLIYRNNSPQAGSGYHGQEGTFNLCTLWMVEALTRAGRHDPQRLAQAELMFAAFLGLSNHLGLYAEELHPNGKALGNFPQAFTCLALISAAYNLDEITAVHKPPLEPG